MNYPGYFKEKMINYERSLRPKGQKSKFQDRPLEVPEESNGDKVIFKEKLSRMSRLDERHQFLNS